MRLAPVPMFFHPDAEQAIHYAGESSRTTHAAQECVDACRLMASIIVRLLSGATPEDALVHDNTGFVSASPKIAAIATCDYVDQTEDQIRGNGYVVDSLEAALWCFVQTGTYRDATLKAANLGDDADTTAAVCGQIAGAYYGESGIPAERLEKLCMRDRITAFADKLRELGK
jgi:ADP-ribosyl-[dinitrogen reductase] hydrolase